MKFATILCALAVCILFPRGTLAPPGWWVWSNTKPTPEPTPKPTPPTPQPTPEPVHYCGQACKDAQYASNPSGGGSGMARSVGMNPLDDTENLMASPSSEGVFVIIIQNPREVAIGIFMVALIACMIGYCVWGKKKQSKTLRIVYEGVQVESDNGDQ